MTDCDKFRKKHNIGLVIFFLMLPVVFYGRGQSGWIPFLVLLLDLTLGLIGILLMLPYLRCTADALNRRKPPFSR